MAILTEKATHRLRPYERTPSGRIKNYYDPETHYVWSARQFRKARAGGVTAEQRQTIRAAGLEDLQRKVQKSGEDLNMLLEAYQHREQIETGKKRSKKAILQDPKFRKAAEGITHKRSTSPKGVRAKALEEFGLRPRNAPWRAGESPKKNGQTFGR